ncbi:methyl-accepting chemotaxis protein [Stutzerimonas sp. NM35]
MLLILMIGIAVVASWQVGIINSTLTEIVDGNAVKQRQAINFRGSVHDRAIAFRDLALLHDAGEHQASLEEIQRLTLMYEESARRLDAIFSNPASGRNEERALLDAIKAIERHTQPMLDRILAHYRAGDREAAERVLMQDARPAFSDWLASINRFIDWQESKSQHETGITRATAGNFTSLMFILCAIGVLIGGSVAYMITRYLLHSLGGEPRKVAAVVQRIADGDLSVTIRTDYAHSISAAVADMQTKLREMVMQIVTTGSDIGSQITHLNESSRNMLRSTEEQAARSTAAAASLEEMFQSLREVSGITQHAETNSVKAAELSASGVELVRSVADEVAVVARTVTDTSEQITSLQKRSEEISGITGAIRGIADQTNLLALNAAIEAARAGDNGRGFAVVADEVRQLAQRTTEATEEIAQMLVLIQNETRSAVTAMQATGTQVQQGLELANEAAGHLEEIRGQSQDSLRNVRHIVELTEQQVTAIGEIARHVERISLMSGETSEATQGNARATEALERTTRLLEQEIRCFRIS